MHSTLLRLSSTVLKPLLGTDLLLLCHKYNSIEFNSLDEYKMAAMTLMKCKVWNELGDFQKELTKTEYVLSFFFILVVLSKFIRTYIYLLVSIDHIQISVLNST